MREIQKIDISAIRDEYLSKTTFGNGISGNAAKTSDVKMLAATLNEIIKALEEISPLTT